MHLSIQQPPVAPEPPAKMKITVKFSARKIEIEVDKTDTVRSLKEKIHIVDGTPIRRMTLFFNGTEMEDDFRSLTDYGVHETSASTSSSSSEVIVFLKTMTRVTADPPARRVGVVVQTSASLMNAARIPVEMNDTSRVEELRQLLLERGMLPADDYIFIHKQRIMRDDCSLRWHGVENGDFLYVFKGSVTRAAC
ncbi:uncharacterized protein LOC127240476 [Andrographis paniculata]|uniref:uncharacterized protein LOC127240476 n=1 Tax=Andrographis paniculata TaxID=175694 RepID=UPI0021E810F2|nr:uncharacterized protein LOC127240476 [Andrographis paniculata]